MAGRRAIETYATFLDVFQSALSCVTRAQVKAAHRFIPDGENRLILTERDALLGRNRALRLRLDHSFRVIETTADDWRIQTIAYGYWLSDTNGGELALYQWEPHGRSPVRTPHIHIGKALASGDIPEAVRRRFSQPASAHLPTGLIPVTDILRSAIRDFGVEPLRRVPGDSATIDWDGIDRLLRAADVALRESFEEAEGVQEP